MLSVVIAAAAAAAAAAVVVVAATAAVLLRSIMSPVLYRLRLRDRRLRGVRVGGCDGQGPVRPAVGEVLRVQRRLIDSIDGLI